MSQQIFHALCNKSSTGRILGVKPSQIARLEPVSDSVMIEFKDGSTQSPVLAFSDRGLENVKHQPEQWLIDNCSSTDYVWRIDFKDSSNESLRTPLSFSPVRCSGNSGDDHRCFVDSKDKCPRDAVVLPNDDGTFTCMVH